MIETKNPLANARIVGVQVDPAAYHKTGKEIERGSPAFVMSRSELLNFASCPARWRNGYDPDAHGKHVDWGTLIDCLYLDPDRFKKAFVVSPETYPDNKTQEPKPWNWSANFCKAWREEQADGVKIVNAETKSDAERAMTVLARDDAALELQKHSQRQVFVMGEYIDPNTGLTIPVKALIDFAPSLDSRWPKSLGDFKTTNDASPFKWVRRVFDDGLHVQAALYLDSYVCATGEDRLDFIHLIQESVLPFQIGKRILSQEYIELGRQKYLIALRDYCQCLKTDIWPDYETGRMVIDGFSITEPEPWMVSKS